MPLLGEGHSLLARDEHPFFGTLSQFDSWFDTASLVTHRVIPYFPRHHPATSTTSPRGRLLVCHDFKGGYSEKPEETTYTFNFWSLCDTFVYFSHHRVTIPPSGWISSAHRQGAKILGTLIFEHQESEEDCLRLLFGRLPASKTGPAVPPLVETSPVPLSPHYARLLAYIARQRGFDGYLLNFEWHLRADAGIGQARALTAWISLLRSELKVKVGPHAEAVWYDSLVFNGQVRWQDRLNNHNLPFFLPSTGFFTNYTWPPEYPSLTSQFFLSLDPSLISTHLHSGAAKILQDIHIGVDVWGRGSHGGGGFGSYRAIEHIDPTSLGLSVALFGPGWTWETIQDKKDFSWGMWWEAERRLWVGPPEKVTVPPMTKRHEEEPDCLHGSFRPFSDFFATQPPPDPVRFPFCTSFSPGVGFAWFVNGAVVMPRTEHGWTDVDKQSALGDMLWPKPQLQWEDREGTTEPVPDASSTLHFDDAWLGGNSLQVVFNATGSDAEDAFFRCVWLPIQSLSVTPLVEYTAHVIFKAVPTVDPPVDIDVGLSIKCSGSILEPSAITVAEDLTGGWTRQTLTFALPENPRVASVTVGLVVGFATEDPSKQVQFSILLGQLAVYPAPPPPSPHLSLASPRILWADFQRRGEDRSGSGVLTWEIGASFPPISLPRTVPAVDSPTPLWSVDNSDYGFPSYAYFNIYAGAALGGPTRATFIGTTGLDGRANRFYVDWEVLPDAVKDLKDLRFFVQGVTDRGEVTEWGQCAFVDTF